MTGAVLASGADVRALMAPASAATTTSAVATTGVAAIGAACEGAAACISGAAACFGCSLTPCTAAATGFDASTIDMLVAIAAAAIASGSVVPAGDTGAATMSVAATGTAIAVATAAGVTLVRAAACADAAVSADVVGSVAVTISEIASLAAAFTMPVFAGSGFDGLATVPASALEPVATDCTALGSSSCEGVVAVAFEEDAALRGCRPLEAVDGSPGRSEGRSGAVGRSLPAAPATLLSISAEKLSGAGVSSAFAVLDGAF